MATSGKLLPLLLFALAIVSGVLLEGGDSTDLSHRLLSASAPPPPAVCPRHYCDHAHDSNGKKLPNCCVNPGGGLFCTNLKTDDIHCGACNAKCSPVGGCCNGVCTNYQTDPNNCGGCKHVCKAPKTQCVNTVCTT